MFLMDDQVSFASVCTGCVNVLQVVFEGFQTPSYAVALRLGKLYVIKTPAVSKWFKTMERYVSQRTLEVISIL